MSDWGCFNGSDALHNASFMAGDDGHWCCNNWEAKQILSNPDMRKNISLVACGVLILFTYFTTSCSHTKDPFSPNVIPLESTVGNYHLLNLSDYVTEIRYIPLETTESNLMGEIKQIVYEDEKIVVSDKHNSCYLFDNDGNLFCKVGSEGRGPNEYLIINHLMICDGFIFLNDRSKVIIYDTSGRLVENINLRSPEMPTEYYIRNVLPLKKDTFVMDVVTYNNEYCPAAVLFASHLSNAKPIKEYPSNVKLNKVISGGFSVNEEAKMYRFKDEIRTYKFINCDTLFTIGQDMEMKEAFIFELGRFKPTTAYLEWRDRSSGGFIRPEVFFESLSHLFIIFNFGKYAPEPFKYVFTFPGSDPRERINSNVCGVFDKSLGKLTLMRQPIKEKLGFKNDIDNGPVLWPHYISSNNELVTYITAEEFFEYYGKIEKPTPQMIELSKRIAIDDNPIAIVAKLKTH